MKAKHVAGIAITVSIVAGAIGYAAVWFWGERQPKQPLTLSTPEPTTMATDNPSASTTETTTTFTQGLLVRSTTSKATTKTAPTSSSTTTTTRPPRPDCEPGVTAEWGSSAGEWVCERPPVPDCDKNDGAEWKPVWNGAGGWWCYHVPDCGSALITIIVEDRFECSETQATAEQFWKYAFYTVNLSGRGYRWIGGLASSLNFEGQLPDGSARTRADSSAYKALLSEIAEGIKVVDICWEHNCTGNGLIGSTSVSRSPCKAWIWTSEEGLWFLMRIDEVNEECVRAYQLTETGWVNGASTGEASCWHDENEGLIEEEYGLVQTCEMVTIGEISIGGGSDTVPADMNTWVAATDLR